MNADAAKMVSKLISQLEGGKLIEKKEEPGELPELPNEKKKEESAPLPKIAIKNGELIDDTDIEEIVLRELEDEYVPGNPNGEGKEDIPPLNEAIPVSSDMFEDDN